MSECFTDVVDTAVEHSRAELQIRAYAEFVLKNLVGRHARKHCGIVTAGRVSRHAHIVKVEIVFFRICANPVESGYEMLQSLREKIFRAETVVDVDHEEAFVCRPFGKTSAVVLVACHKSAAVNVEEHGIFFVSVFFDVISVELASIVIVVCNICFNLELHVFEAEHLLVVLRSVEHFVDCYKQKLRKSHNNYPFLDYSIEF